MLFFLISSPCLSCRVSASTAFNACSQGNEEERIQIVEFQDSTRVFGGEECCLTQSFLFGSCQPSSTEELILMPIHRDECMNIHRISLYKQN